MLHDGVWWWYVMSCVSVWWSVVMCDGVLTNGVLTYGVLTNGCGGDDGSAGSAVPFPILDRFGPNKNCNMSNTIWKNQPYQTTSSEHTLTGNLI